MYLAEVAEGLVVLWIGWVMYRRKYQDPLTRPLAVALTMAGATLGVGMMNLAINIGMVIFFVGRDP